MSEQQLQTKIINWLKQRNFWVVKIITCNRKGVMDIIACAPTGRFVGIEVKSTTGRLSELQSWNIKEVRDRGGIAFVAYDLPTVEQQLKQELSCCPQLCQQTTKDRQPLDL